MECFTYCIRSSARNAPRRRSSHHCSKVKDAISLIIHLMEHVFCGLHLQQEVKHSGLPVFSCQQQHILPIGVEVVNGHGACVSVLDWGASDSAGGGLAGGVNRPEKLGSRFSTDLVQAKKSFCLSMTSCNEQWSLTVCISNGDKFWMLRSNGCTYSHPSDFCCQMERKTSAPWMVIRDGYMQSCVFRFSELSFLSPGICDVKRHHFFPLLSHGNFEEMIQ